MKSIISLLGIALLAVGILALAYQGITYQQEDKIAQLGQVTVSAEHPKTIYFPPVLGGICALAGLVLVVVGRK